MRVWLQGIPFKFRHFKSWKDLCFILPEAIV